jgi:hypothetical protein
MENMFRVEDKASKVDHYGIISWLLNWKLEVGNCWIRKNLENIDFIMSIDEKGGSFALFMQ